MTTEGINRKLVAIISADVKDYSRLMSQDQVGTIRTLNTHREIFSDLVRQYKGRIVDTPGDNILATFESVSNAVNCAVEIQREFAGKNIEVPSARKMQWLQRASPSLENSGSTKKLRPARSRFCAPSEGNATTRSLT